MKYLRAYNASHPYLWTNDQNRNPYADLYNSKLPAQSVIKADLEYVAKYWSRDGFDLWEEVQGLHYFTAAVQLRALREGVDLAIAFNDLGAASYYEDQAKELEKLTQKFWDESKNHMVETLDSQRSGLDCALLLGALHGNPTGKVGGFTPYSDEVLVSLLEFVKDQRSRFPINSIPQDTGEIDDLAGVGVGRYPEDVYNGYGTSANGGNPWFLCTASVAEVLFRTASHLQISQKLTVTERGSPFWAALSHADKLKPGFTYLADDPLFNIAVKRLQDLADEYLEVIRTHSSAQGQLSEQFDRYTGYERGAGDLTWSYGAFLDAIAARKETLGRN
jgi:glucoamylase